jgi:hypothetical protein
MKYIIARILSKLGAGEGLPKDGIWFKDKKINYFNRIGVLKVACRLIFNGF